MKKGLLVTLALSCLLLSAMSFAQDVSARPMFKALPPHSYGPVQQAEPAAQLPQWTYTFTSSVDHKIYKPVIVGTDPSTTNTKTTVTVAIIPIKMVYGPGNGNMTFDPNTPYVGSVSTVQMVMKSPMFNSYLDFNQGGTDVGKTQYGDAYERANFWGSVQTNTNYHLLLKAVLGPTQTINVANNQGKVISNPWGGYPTGTMEINAFDSQLHALIRKFTKIQPNILPLFITYNVYLTQFGGCCIGGYHSALGLPPGAQTYSHASILAQAQNPVFSQDISALSHEIGEWILDPFVNNSNACGGLMENGDPLVKGPNFGTYPYKVKGFTFHPQDLVFVTYFGAPLSTSLNGWTTFQNEPESPCQDGQ